MSWVDRRLRAWLALSSTAFVCFASAPCAAAASLRVPADCGSEAEFERELDRRLGREARRAPTTVSIDPVGEGYVLRMRVGNETRELRALACRELFRAAVVVAASIALSETRRPEPEVEPAASPRSDSQRNERTERAAAAPRVLTGLLGVSGGVHLGHSPRPAPLLGLDARLLASHFGVALGLRYLAPSSSRDDSERGVEVTGIGAELSAVYAPVPTLEARLGASLYRLSGEGIGSPGNRSDAAWSGGPLAGVAFYPLQRGRFWAGGAVEGEWHWVRARFQILNYGEVFRVPRFGGSALARLGFRFY